MRDFQVFVERGGDLKTTGDSLLKQVGKSFKLWRKMSDGLPTRNELKARMEPIKETVRKLLEEDSRSTYAKTRRTCQNILKVDQSLWKYVEVDGVEPTNNQAEKGLRRGVLWRRKSFGTQSESESRFVERILSVAQTLRQQGRDLLEFLTMACTATRIDNRTLSLSPDSS